MDREVKSLLLEEVRSHRPASLRPVETLVTNVGGSRVVERKTPSGGFFSHVLPTSNNSDRNYKWFAEDYRPDLQVAVVLPGLMLGAQDVATDLYRIRKLGITHILNLATGVPNCFPQEITYKRVDIRDTPDMNIRRHFDDCFRFIDEGRRRGWVYVHCNAGISRAATMVIGYLMSRERMRFDRALKSVRDVRPIVSPNYGFTQQLKDYDVELFVPGRMALNLILMLSAVTFLMTFTITEGRYLPTRSDSHRFEYIKELLRQVLNMDSDDVKSQQQQQQRYAGYPYDEDAVRESLRHRNRAPPPSPFNNARR